MLNVEASNLLFLKTYNTEFYEIIHLINRNDTLFYRTKKKKYVKRYGFLSFAKNLCDKYKKKILLDTATKAGQYATKTAFIKEVHKTDEGTGEFVRNKIAQKSWN